jgi:outer membrane protein OmpA-like peptidoglycan-associated protein
MIAIDDDYDIPQNFEDAGIKGINSEHNEGTITFDSSYTEMYFTKCFVKEKKYADNCLIYRSDRDENGEWGEGRLVKIFGDSVTVGHPHLYDDDTKMVFASNISGGQGGKDLYMMERTEKGWGTPRNLGPTINTAGDEMFPFVHSDGTLYFASDGHVGMGGLDMFMALPQEGEWKSIDNLQAPINSGYDDYGLIFDEFETLNQSGYYEANGYYVSNRPGGTGADDIYKFTLRKPAYFELVVEVLKKQYKDPYDPESDYDFIALDKADIILFKINEVGLLDTVETTISDLEGKAIFSIDPETDYQVLASRDNLSSNDQFKYLAQRHKVSTKEIKTYRIKITLTLEIILEPAIPKRAVTVNNIYYNFDRWNIRSDAAQILDNLASLLKENKQYMIEMGSHTDSRGSTSYNERLSQRRADAVIKYLASKGVPRSRLRAKGYGESTLVNDCNDGSDCSEAQHQENRRTTFTIIGEDETIKSNAPKIIPIDPEMLRREREGLIKKDVPEGEGEQEEEGSEGTEEASETPEDPEQ